VVLIRIKMTSKPFRYGLYGLRSKPFRTVPLCKEGTGTAWLSIPYRILVRLKTWNGLPEREPHEHTNENYQRTNRVVHAMCGLSLANVLAVRVRRFAAMCRVRSVAKSGDGGRTVDDRSVATRNACVDAVPAARRTGAGHRAANE
jgi:hypothetical protein